MKINKTVIRRTIANKLFEKFIQSGEEYTCPACVYSVRPDALAYAKELLEQGINLSKSNYPIAFTGLMADMFLNDTIKLVHAHWCSTHAQ